MKIRVAYPSEAEELQILERHHAGTGASLLEDATIAPIPAGMLEAARAEVRAIRIEPELYGYILALARRTREWPTLLLGASPRAALSLMRVAQADGGVRWPRLPCSRRRQARDSARAASSRDAQARGRARRLRRRPRPHRRHRRGSGSAAMIAPSFHPGTVRATCEPRGRWSFGLTPRSIALLIAGFTLSDSGLLGCAPELRNAGVGRAGAARRCCWTECACLALHNWPPRAPGRMRPRSTARPKSS